MSVRRRASLWLFRRRCHVKPGSFVGVAAMPGEGAELKAMEVHIFPEAMRGTGEGHRPFDLGPAAA